MQTQQLLALRRREITIKQGLSARPTLPLPPPLLQQQQQLSCFKRWETTTHRAFHSSFFLSLACIHAKIHTLTEK
jgi:hypothetical protein